IALCERIEDKLGTVCYIDPPYLRKDAQYLYDFRQAQHARLAQVLRRFEKTRVVVSYYEHEALASLYPAKRWRKVPMSVQKNLSVTAGKGKAPEVLLINTPT